MRRVKRFLKISIVLTAFIKVTSFAYANGLQFKPYDQQIIQLQNQLQFQQNRETKQSFYFMQIATEKKQAVEREMDAKRRASISNIIGSYVQKNANIAMLAGHGYSDLFAEINF